MFIILYDCILLFNLLIVLLYCNYIYEEIIGNLKYKYIYKFFIRCQVFFFFYL